MHQSHPPRSALLIIDMQVGLFHGPDQPFEAQRVLDNICMLIGKARQAGMPVFAARHTGPQGSPIEAGSSLWQLLPALQADIAVERVFDKTRPSCFLGTDLAAQLHAANVQRLVIAGMKTQYCVDTTCRVASELGWQVLLAGDAHTCMDTPALSAADIIAHHNATLNGPFANVQTSAAIQF